MGKRIVVLSGSPRKVGNTSKLVSAFVEGAQSTDNEVEVFYLQGMDIHSCLGCGRGQSDQEMPCIQKDDMAQIYPALRNSDVVVFATPLYYWTFSGQLKNTIDRFFALEETQQNLRGHNRSAALLMSAEGNDFEDATTYFNHLMDHLKWKNLGSVLSSGNGDPTDIEGKPELEQARELGASIQ